MTVEQQAERLINEAWQHAPSSGATRDALAVKIAIWCAEEVLSEVGASFSEAEEYWQDVVNYLKNK